MSVDNWREGLRVAFSYRSESFILPIASPPRLAASRHRRSPLRELRTTDLVWAFSVSIQHVDTSDG